MRTSRFAVSAVLIVLAHVAASGAAVAQAAQRGRAAAPYVPGATWERRSPSAAGIDSAKLAEAIAFAVQREARAPRVDRPPFELMQAHLGLAQLLAYQGLMAR
ncbi:MAG: hypothetical protein ACLGIK_12280, partial [Gemmatimonadota bacterium]